MPDINQTAVHWSDTVVAFAATYGLFLASLSRYAILGFTILAMLDRFGIQTASIIAMLSAAGLAIGLALQGTRPTLRRGSC
jgi:small-conductance mechanosensitive channel